ncbi:glycosyltransferase [Sphingomonas sp. MMS24-JH45]
MRAYAGHPALRREANLVILAGQHAHACAEEAIVLAELTALAADPRVRGRIALPPRHDAEDVAALYARASQGGVFVNPALHEPFGLTLIEAAAAGVPVVSTRNGGPGDIVAAIGHGILVDPRDNRDRIGDPRRDLRRRPPCRSGSGGEKGRARLLLASVRGGGDRDLCRGGDPALPRQRHRQHADGVPQRRGGLRQWRRRSALPFIVATGRGIDAARLILNRWRLPMPDAFVTDVGTTLTLPDGAGGWRACRRLVARSMPDDIATRSRRCSPG